jgi:hypothetical protein
MKVTIIRLHLNHLWNNEYCMFVSQIVAIFLQFNPEMLRLQKSFGRLNAMMPEIAKIKAQEQGNAISHQLSDLNAERRTVIRTMWDLVKNFGKLNMPMLAQQVVLMSRFLEKHGSDLSETNYNDGTKRFNDLLDEYSASPELQSAAAALQLGIFFDHLREINRQFAGLYLQRNDENTSVETVDTHAIRTETDKALIAFFDAFEFCSTEYEELDYKTPADKMNGLISSYKSQLKARTTRRNSGKDVHTEDPIKAD